MKETKEIIRALDIKLISTKKSFLSLSQANKILVEAGIFNEEDIVKKKLKRLLEERIILNAYQTVHEPKQWRIILSEEYATKHNSKNNVHENTIEQEEELRFVYCPNCGTPSKIINSKLHESILTCQNCQVEFANPKSQIVIDQIKKVSSEKPLKLPSEKLVAGLVLLIIIIIVVVKVLSEGGEETRRSTPSPPITFSATEENSQNEKAINAERLRKSNEMNYGIKTKSSKTSSNNETNNQETGNTRSKIILLKSLNYDIEKPGVPGYKTIYEATTHKFDFVNMRVTQRCKLNGEYVRLIYPFTSFYIEQKAGTSTYVLVVNSMGVKEIWYSPDNGNLGYDYLDGTRIACYDVTIVE